jgi:hypothetical protein
VGSGLIKPFSSVYGKLLTRFWIAAAIRRTRQSVLTASVTRRTQFIDLLTIHLICDLFRCLISLPIRNFAAASSDDIIASLRRLPENQSFRNVLPVVLLKQVSLAPTNEFISGIKVARVAGCKVGH